MNAVVEFKREALAACAGQDELHAADRLRENGGQALAFTWASYRKVGV